MSLLKSVFGKSKSVEHPVKLPEAIQKIKQTQDMLIKKQNHLEMKIKKETMNAKNHVGKNKKAALEALQKKKRYERQLQQVDGVLTKLEAQLDIVDRANSNSVVVATMKQATDALKSAQKCLSTDQVEELLDDLADQRDITEDISNAISQPVGFDDDIDEDELEKELQLLELEDEEISDGKKTKLPSVPKETVADEKVKQKPKKAEAVAAQLLA